MASLLPKKLSAWVLTDGKAGDESQCLGVVEALGLKAELRRVSPRAPFVWAMPYGPIDPREAPGRPQSPIAPPFPDLAVGSGRRAIAYLRHIKQASGGRTFTAILKDPRIGAGAADLIWVPEHDALRGENVVVTLTSPHRLSRERLEAARQNPPATIAALAKPRVALLIGGDSRHHRFTAADIARFAASLDRLAGTGAALMGTLSRRTPPALAKAVEAIFRRNGGFLWDGTGDNPYAALLANADAVVVTADSTNMVGEATAAGVPVLLFEPTGGHPKMQRFIERLRTLKIVHNFNGALEGERYEPLDATPVVAAAIAKAYLAHRSASGA